MFLKLGVFEPLLLPSLAPFPHPVCVGVYTLLETEATLYCSGGIWIGSTLTQKKQTTNSVCVYVLIHYILYVLTPFHNTENTFVLILCALSHLCIECTNSRAAGRTLRGGLTDVWSTLPQGVSHWFRSCLYGKRCPAFFSSAVVSTSPSQVTGKRP
jgi:hypothetical protein